MSTKATEWEAIKNAYSGATTPDDGTVKDQYNSIVTSYNKAYKALSEVVDLYNSDSYASTLVSKTQNVKMIKTSVISTLIIVLGDVVVIALILVIIVAIEKKKQSKEIKIENKTEYYYLNRRKK